MNTQRARRVWRSIGVKTSPERIADHWRKINQWRNRKPKTIGHMSTEKLQALREEIISALLAAPFGTTKERAGAYQRFETETNR